MVTRPTDRGTELSRPWNAFGSPFSLLRNDLDRFFDDFWRRNGLTNWLARLESAGMYFPSVNVSETNDAYRVTADLPGMRREDVQVSAEGDSLVISGSRTEETEEGDRSFLCRECVTGEFRRVLNLDDADVSKAQATMTDGVLQIDVPKSPESSRRRRTIPIETSAPKSSTSTERASKNGP